jgi:transcriptional adapter 2-alpha
MNLKISRDGRAAYVAVVAECTNFFTGIPVSCAYFLLLLSRHLLLFKTVYYPNSFSSTGFKLLFGINTVTLYNTRIIYIFLTIVQSVSASDAKRIIMFGSTSTDNLSMNVGCSIEKGFVPEEEEEVKEPEGGKKKVYYDDDGSYRMSTSSEESHDTESNASNTYATRRRASRNNSKAQRKSIAAPLKRTYKNNEKRKNPGTNPTPAVKEADEESMEIEGDVKDTRVNTISSDAEEADIMKSFPKETDRSNLNSNSNDPSSSASISLKEKVMMLLSLEGEEDKKKKKRTKDQEDEEEVPLVLTGEKRRGVFECDYCRREITPFPRIRCAVCEEFDLCLDCFANSASNNKSNRHPQHKASHPYRVADSTRFPLFPTGSTMAIPIITEDDSASASASYVNKEEDESNMWTAEEDLRLLDALKTHGLGNWTEIAEAIGNPTKNAKRCMERYLDDYLGRFGHILPPQIYVEVPEEEEQEEETIDHQRSDRKTITAAIATPTATTKPSTRKSLGAATTTSTTRAIPITQPKKKTRRVCVDTSLISTYESVWPDPYLPEGTTLGKLVNRDIVWKLEQVAVKAGGVSNAVRGGNTNTTSAADSYDGRRLVIPPRWEDIQALPGSELAGYMPRRGDFDVEWDNDAENILADMEFSSSDPPAERALKLQVLEIYNEKLDEREHRKQFCIDRDLVSLQKNQLLDKLRPPEEKDLVNRMRLFARFHSKEEHERFLTDLLRAKQIRQEIERLQTYRKMGFRTLLEAEKYELEKNRRFQLNGEAPKLKEPTLGRSNSVSVFDSTANTTASVVPMETSDIVVSNSETETTKGDNTLNSSASHRLEQVDEEKNIFDEGKHNINDEHCTEESLKNPLDDGDVNVAEGTENSKHESIDPTAIDTKNSVTASNIDAEGDFKVVGKPGCELLSSKEITLCTNMRLDPQHYLAVKRILIQESLQCGLLPTDGEAKKAVFQLDIHQQKGVIEFVFKSGWISTKPNFGV